MAFSSLAVDAVDGGTEFEEAENPLGVRHGRGHA
jgi:hypothetical protein